MKWACTGWFQYHYFLTHKFLFFFKSTIYCFTTRPLKTLSKLKAMDLFEKVEYNCHNDGFARQHEFLCHHVS